MEKWYIYQKDISDFLLRACHSSGFAPFPGLLNTAFLVATIDTFVSLLQILQTFVIQFLFYNACSRYEENVASSCQKKMMLVLACRISSLFPTALFPH